jgi:large conductance mechanosensitive channel
MKEFLTEFKQFAMKGNVIDLAVGVVIGTAFGKIVSSLVGDVVMPLIGLVLGKINFTTLVIGPVAIGNFIQASVDFLIIAFVVFLAIKIINKK